MILSPKTDNDAQINKYFTKIDFGDVPVGSVHKRSIEITNDLKASSRFIFPLSIFVKMYDPHRAKLKKKWLME